MNAIVVEKIKKSSGIKKKPVVALSDISFEVKTGELFGFIGADGAGKTTLFRILTTLLIPDSGKVSIGGMDVVDDFKKIRKIIGYMPGKFSLYQDLTVEENIQFFATIFNTTLTENYHLVKDIYSHLENFKDRKAGALSGGMKQKLALCCALIHKPKILFLDEPTTGVDAVSRKEFWELLKSLQEKNITIVVSTPYMDEATLCDRVALIHQGLILQINEPQVITQNFGKPLWAFQSDNMYKLRLDLLSLNEVESCYPFGQYHHVTLNNPDNILEVESKIKSKNHELRYEKIPASIEDCFLSLMSERKIETPIPV